jgi:hypothetical protein
MYQVLAGGEWGLSLLKNGRINSDYSTKGVQVAYISPSLMFEVKFPLIDEDNKVVLGARTVEERENWINLFVWALQRQDATRLFTQP